MKKKLLVAIIVSLIVIIISNDPPHTAMADEKTNSPEQSSDIWKRFQHQSNGRYCFSLRGKDCPNGHLGSLIITIKDTIYKLEQSGLFCPGNNNYFYSEEYKGLRKGDKIAAKKSNFKINKSSLSVKHFMTDKSVTYVIEKCQEKK